MRWFFRTFFPALFEKMKAESQTWIMHCPNCGQQTSVWDAGGLRYKARGEPSWRRRCQTCGEVAFHKVTRQQT